MKRIVLTFGLISGAILAAMMALTLPFMDRIGFDNAMVVGYTTMVLAFLLVFFGIRSYRDTVGNGRISFGRAMGVGLLIAAVGGTCYVVAWEIISYKFIPDFADKCEAHAIEGIRKSGKPPAEIAQEIEKTKEMMSLYKNNFLFNVAITFLEPLPVGILMTLISALILRKRAPTEQQLGTGLPDLQN